MITGPISQGSEVTTPAHPELCSLFPEDARPFQAPSLPTDWGAARALDVATPCVTDFSSPVAHQKVLGGGSELDSFRCGVRGKESQSVLASLTDRGSQLLWSFNKHLTHSEQGNAYRSQAGGGAGVGQRVGQGVRLERLCWVTAHHVSNALCSPG